MPWMCLSAVGCLWIHCWTNSYFLHTGYERPQYLHLFRHCSKAVFHPLRSMPSSFNNIFRELTAPATFNSSLNWSINCWRWFANCWRKVDPIKPVPKQWKVDLFGCRIKEGVVDLLRALASSFYRSQSLMFNSDEPWLWQWCWCHFCLMLQNNFPATRHRFIPPHNLQSTHLFSFSTRSIYQCRLYFFLKFCWIVCVAFWASPCDTAKQMLFWRCLRDEYNVDFRPWPRAPEKKSGRYPWHTYQATALKSQQRNVAQWSDTLDYRLKAGIGFLVDECASKSRIEGILNIYGYTFCKGRLNRGRINDFGPARHFHSLGITQRRKCKCFLLCGDHR